MKLTTELVPRNGWNKNLRTSLPKVEWDKIRKQSYEDSDHKCSICGAKERLNCHEIWSYDDPKCIQTLKGFQALCDKCHMIKHLGFAGIQASKGKLDMDKLIQHFCEVNNVNEDYFEEYKNKVFQQWNERSQHKWKTDLGRWKDLVK